MTKHRGTYARKPQWWKHLRDWKRVFWKRDRRAPPEIAVLCVRQADAWCWPEYLGPRMEGVCARCGAPIYFQERNEAFRKVCVQCEGLGPVMGLPS